MSHEGNDRIMDQIRDELSEEVINAISEKDLIELAKSYLWDDWKKDPKQFMEDLGKYGSKLPIFNKEN
tara:strand:- start:314 stop:517 length:204 start_codon:yes stop_codon:yes gene_type:complete